MTHSVKQHVQQLTTLSAFTLLSIGCNQSVERSVPMSVPMPQQQADRAHLNNTINHSSLTDLPVIEAAEASAQQGTIGLAECLVLALAGNREYRSVLSQLTVTDLQRTKARAQVHAPRLTAEYSIIRNQNDTAEARAEFSTNAFGFALTPFIEENWTQNGLSVTNDDSYGTRAGITLSRRILAFSESDRLNFPITRADTRYQQQVNDRQVALRDLIFDVQQAFYRVQRSSARLGVRQIRVTDAEAFLESVRQSIAFGFTAASEEANAIIDLSRAESDLISEQAAYQDSLENLLSVLNLDLDTAMVISASDLRQVQLPERDLTRDLSWVMLNHERIQNALSDTELIELELGIAVDDVRPDLSLNVTAARDLEGNSAFGEEIERENELTITLGLDIPLDGWREARAERDQIIERLRQQRITTRSIQIDLERDLRRLFRNIEEQRVQLEIATARRNAERERLDGFLARYENGEITNLEVTRAKSSLSDAQISMLDASINLVLADAEYQSLLPSQAPLAPVANPANDQDTSTQSQKTRASTDPTVETPVSNAEVSPFSDEESPSTISPATTDQHKLVPQQSSPADPTFTEIDSE